MLMAKLAEGDRAALAPLYAGLWPKMSRLCSGLLGNEAEGEDVAQQALLKMVGQSHRYDQEQDVVGWALSIAAWECKSVLRRDARRRTLLFTYKDSLPQGQGPPNQGSDNAEKNINLEQLRSLLGSLSVAEREIVELILSGKETPAGAAWRKRKQRAIHRLRMLWREHERSEEADSR